MEKIYSLTEAAALLQLTKNALARAARKIGRGSLFGRDLRFTEADLTAIMEAMRVERTEPLRTNRGAPLPALDDAYDKLLKRAQRARQDAKDRRQKAVERARRERQKQKP